MNAIETETLKLAVQHHLKNDFNQAYLSYKKLIDSNPANFHALHFMGILLIQNGELSLGVGYIKNAISIKPDYLEAIENLTVFDKSEQSKIKRELDSIDKQKPYPKRSLTNVDAWRHLRMLDFADCFSSPIDTWLTIGDAYGHDAKLLGHFGVRNVAASNLDSTYLQVGHELGEVGDYLTVNAEDINLPDGSFDYVLCKEALHHMPRPHLAIYEMLRVSRKGVAFIEPQDQYIDWPTDKRKFYRQMVSDEVTGEKISFRYADDDSEIIKTAIDWWEDGAFNYVFTYSKREIRKIALGIGLPFFAYKCFNDYYKEALSEEPAEPGNKALAETMEQIALHDKVCEIVGKPHTYISGLLFKNTPPREDYERLQKKGFEVVFTPTRFLPIKWPDLG